MSYVGARVGEFCPLCQGTSQPLSYTRDRPTSDWIQGTPAGGMLPVSSLPSQRSILRVAWSCVKCLADYETQEVEGVPNSRVLVQISTQQRNQYHPVVSSTQISISSAAINALRPELDVPDEEPDEAPPTLEGSVIGYRGWKIKDWKLWGTGGLGLPWFAGINKAEHGMDSTRHAAPEWGCDCGMYGLARFDDSVSWWRGADVLGAIEAWTDSDRFFVHPTGFRAEFARIVLLAYEDHWPRARIGATKGFAADHHADVCKKEHLPDAAKEHGQLLSDEMLAWAAG